MCGIFFACSRQSFVDPSERQQELLRARGPDRLAIHHVFIDVNRKRKKEAAVDDSSSKTFLTFASSVLSLRGTRVHSQPLIDPVTQSVFCWNGEAWLLDGAQILGNDTEIVFELLLKCVKKLDRGASPAEVIKALARIAGPYAFVFYDAKAEIVYFARDRLGRRSLISNVSGSVETDAIFVSSVQVERRPAIEVDTNGIYYIDCSDPVLRMQSEPWRAPLSTVNCAVLPSIGTIGSAPSMAAVSTIQFCLRESITLRARHVPTSAVSKHSSFNDKTESRVAILFSGGVDCALLARLAHEVLDQDVPIDLLNVAFENPRTRQAAEKASKSLKSAETPIPFYEVCPDRMTGRSTFEELCLVCPEREWRFVAIDVPYTETLTHRRSITNLMSPHNTEMDLSISLALHFAARGKGMATSSRSSDGTAIPYTTPARVLLSGLGADELFGGYARHGVAFKRAGYEGLNGELDLDISRIGSRNLGRDDRVVSHWGREIRYPYLDESFVALAVSLSAWEKTGFRPDEIVPKHFENTNTTKNNSPPSKVEDLDPAKMALRMALWHLGMRKAASEKKRAIQFGAKTAKMEPGNGRIKGTNVIVSEDS